ncbi:hypothetical protein ILP97_12760 [Amycolatopsis sp. H6(2020)]|nr:hypothetical protein [Amycolatopsis sp. H6(2020)]
MLVFASPRGKPLKPANYLQLLTRAAECAKLPVVFGPYTVRRGFATRANRARVELKNIRLLMGDAALDQTLDYVQDDVVNEREFLDEFERKPGLRAIEGGAPRGAESHGTTLDDAGGNGFQQLP